MSAAEVERAAHNATVALAEFDRAGVTTVLQTVPALAQTLRELIAAVTSPDPSSPPADDVREAQEAAMEREVTRVLSRLAKRDDWAEDDTAIGGMAAHIVSVALEAAASVRPYGTVTPAPEEWSAQMDAERARQIEHGYDDAHDVEHGAAHLLNWAIDYARRGNNIAAATLARCALRLPYGTVTEPCPICNWTGPSPQYDGEGVAVHHPSHGPQGTVTDTEAKWEYGCRSSVHSGFMRSVATWDDEATWREHLAECAIPAPVARRAAGEWEARS